LGSPELIDHLVTFIACEIVTGRRLTEILGTCPGRFREPHAGGPVQLTHAALRHPARSVCAGRFPD
jgi:hypothetical protein